MNQPERTGALPAHELLDRVPAGTAPGRSTSRRGVPAPLVDLMVCDDHRLEQCQGMTGAPLAAPHGRWPATGVDVRVPAASAPDL